jgi:hypothetical protein
VSVQKAIGGEGLLEKVVEIELNKPTEACQNPVSTQIFEPLQGLRIWIASPPLPLRGGALLLDGERRGGGNARSSASFENN